MAWFKWLAPPSDFDDNIGKRAKGRPERAPWGDAYCIDCGRKLNGWFGGNCSCDPDLGRPRKWYE